MEIQQLQTFDGPSIYCHKPVVRMDIQLGELSNTPTKDIPGFNSRLMKEFPGLLKHECSKGHSGGFLERLEEGTYLPHVMEHLCLEVQNMLGYDVKYGKTRRVMGDVYRIIYAHQNPKVGEACGYSIVSWIQSLIQGDMCGFGEKLNKLKELKDRYSPGPSTQAVIMEAKRRGIPVHGIGDSGVIRLGYGKHQRILSATLYEGTSSMAVEIACDKSLAKAILEEVHIPVPKGKVCLDLDEAKEAAEKFGYPLVVKPKEGNQGKGVSIGISTEEELEWAFAQAKSIGDSVIVEQVIEGRDYRLLVVGGKLAAAAERIPAHVIGDGIHSIKELVDKINQDDRRGNGHEKPLTKIKTDEDTIRILKKQNLSIESIPADEETVYLRENANLSTGGTAVDCTDLVHPENKRIAELAAQTIGLDIAGIDMVIPDISRPIGGGFGAVVEVNAAPGIRMHIHPSEGESRNVAVPILDMIYPPACPHTIPIVSITGTNGKTTTTRMVSHIMQTWGLCVGMTTTHGIYINRECIEEGDTTGPKSAKRILNDRRVEAAVLETARGGIVRDGLAYEKADVGVLTNITGDHLGLDGVDTMEDLLYVKSLVVEAVKPDGAAVLNADDEWAMAAKEGAKGRIILYAMEENNSEIEKHRRSGGEAIYQKNGTISIARGRFSKAVIDICNIPATLGGILRHNIYNSMAAISAAYAVGVPLDTIKEAMMSFTCDADMNPGRFNVYDLGSVRVVLDYGHNIDGYRVTIEGLQALKASRLIGIIGVPGDRRNEDIREVGRLSGKTFDRIFIKEDRDLRGRAPMEVADILLGSVLESGMSRDGVQVIPNEVEALKKALQEGKNGDLIVVFFEKSEPLIQVIDEYKKERIEGQLLQSARV